jgi:hypothetical protein
LDESKVDAELDFLLPIGAKYFANLDLAWLMGPVPKQVVEVVTHELEYRGGLIALSTYVLRPLHLFLQLHLPPSPDLLIFLRKCSEDENEVAPERRAQPHHAAGSTPSLDSAMFGI